MSEEKTIRLAKAASEFNVAMSHIVDLLTAKGFSVDAKPTTKLSEEMYTLLLKEFGKDKDLKGKADQLSIGIGRKLEKEKSEDTVEPVKEVEVKPEPKVEVKPEIKPEPKVEVKPEVIVEKKEVEKPVVEEVVAEQEKPVEEVEVIKARKEKVEDLKVIGKIDLNKKKVKKVEEPVVEKTEPVVAKRDFQVKKADKDANKEIEKRPEVKAPIVEEVVEKKPEREMIETKKVTLEGPKIIGKIEIKEEKKPEKRPHQHGGGAEDPNKKKRKRIKKHERINVDKVKEEDAHRENRSRNPIGVNLKKPAIVDPEAAQRQIQEQIRNTLAKLSGNNQQRGKGARVAKQLKREKREAAEIEAAEALTSNVIQVAEFTSLSELASLMNASPTDLVQSCFNLGMMVSINQRLDAEIIELLAEENGFKVQFINVNEDDIEEEDETDEPDTLVTRPPIVTIMGHVDHGKTSLLDYIRETNVVAGEKGGITQHIGAYEVDLPNGKRIAFLDTPGHEAFTAMRARGAKLTDIAIIVIAADDQVMPQTKEAISHAQAANVPMVFAINKIDKPGANVDKIKEQLSQMNILVEDWGGKFQSQEISAKSGIGVDTLLEKLLLESELLDLKANPDKSAVGSTIEASLDKGRGYVCNIMVQEGTLHVGDMMVAGPYYGKVKAMFDERNQRVNDAGPSTPVLVLGLNGAPQAGEKFKIYDDEAEAKAVANKRSQILREQGIRTKKHITLEEIGRRKALGTFRELNIIIKADVDGSSEALTDSLQKLTTGEVQVNVIFKGVGQITESDVMLASASDAVIVGFQVRPSTPVRKLAEKEGVEIRMYSIIYNAIEEIKAAMEGMLAPKMEEKVTCTVEVREAFKISKVGTVAGCYVSEGKITRNTKIRVLRDGIVIHTGTLSSLKRFKDDAKEVTTSMECGLTIHNFNDIEVGDILEGYEEVEVKRTL
ncbi:MAG: translation initiation factor IF-2 [Bacteroidetes bacterium]|nr:translation initiation factor IF-2 [Bacteroidota bacterium]